MADEPQNTEQSETNPAIANQTPPTVVTVYDVDGREHFASPTSKRIVDGLADGTFTTEPPVKTDEAPADDGEQSTEEATGGAEAGSAGDDPKSGSTDGNDGSEDGSADTGGTGRRRRAGTA
jgi:hypothetical protein